MKKIAIFFLVLVFGCSSKEQKNKSNETSVQNRVNAYLNKKYSKAMSFFSPDLVSHFPEGIDSNYIKLLDAFSPLVGEVSLFLEKKIDLNEFNDLENHYFSASKEVLNPSDSLLIINRFSNEKRIYKIELTDSEKRIVYESVSYSLPVPNFWRSNFSSDSTQCHLSENFKLFVIEAKKGKYLEDEFLTSGINMPPKWKNGFSRGIALSRKDLVAIFWVVIW
jgi:hypothetical protein